MKEAKTLEAKKFYQGIRSVKKGFNPVAHLIKDDNGKLVTDKHGIKVNWKQYIGNLLNCPSPKMTAGILKQVLYTPKCFSL